MNCVQCHDPHGLEIMKPARGLAMARVNEQCASCHREQTKPVVFEHDAMREGCVTCHQPHGSVNNKMLAQPDPNLCLRCHAQAQGMNVGPRQLFIGTQDHTLLVRRGTCWTSGCHTAVHGSNVDRMLRY
jgi:DmsE family decaheme c-type cytochrome